MSDKPSTSPAPTFRASWRDFPEPMLDAMRRAQLDGEARLGPMEWNDALFSQREFHRLFAVLRRNAGDGDEEAAPLYELSKSLRVACPQAESGGDGSRRHMVILKGHPLA